MQELKEAGKMDEADLFDRVPSPHLGSSYRNPKIMERIEECIRKVDTLKYDILSLPRPSSSQSG